MPVSTSDVLRSPRLLETSVVVGPLLHNDDDELAEVFNAGEAPETVEQIESVVTMKLKFATTG